MKAPDYTGEENPGISGSIKVFRCVQPFSGRRSSHIYVESAYAELDGDAVSQSESVEN